MRSTRILLLFVLLYTLTSGAVVKKVSISKCCSMDQYMSKESDFECENERKMPWSATKIFSPRKGDYLPEGQVPKNWDIIENNIPICAENQKPKAFHHNLGSYVALLNGSLFIAEYGQHYFHPAKYCLDHAIALVCLDEMPQPPSRLNVLPNVRRCCGDGAVYSDTKKTCINLKTQDYKVEVNRNYTIITGFPTCDKHMVIAGKFKPADLQSNASFLLQDQNRLLQAETFCLEHVLENAGEYPSIFTCHTDPPTVIKFPGNGDLRFTLYPIGLALSAVFLAATLVAGSLLPASHHVLHWRCQTNHVACLLGGDVLLCITQLSRDTLQGAPCFAIALRMESKEFRN